jgi:hypothetical protein
MSSAHSVFEVIFFFLVQPDCEIELPEIEHGPLPMNIAGSQIAEFPSGHGSPDHCAEHLSRIADIEGRLSSLKHQTRTSMEQDKKLPDLLKKVSSLEEQMSILMAKIVQLKECDVYMTEIIEISCEQLQCKLSGAPPIVFVVALISIYLYSCFPGICLDLLAKIAE